MDPVTTLFGIAMIAYGLYTLYLRSRDPSKFGKLEAMKERFGDSPGFAIHIISYTVIPIVAGGIFVLRGMQGASLF